MLGYIVVVVDMMKKGAVVLWWISAMFLPIFVLEWRRGNRIIPLLTLLFLMIHNDEAGGWWGCDVFSLLSLGLSFGPLPLIRAVPAFVCYTLLKQKDKQKASERKWYVYICLMFCTVSLEKQQRTNCTFTLSMTWSWISWFIYSSI